MRPLRYLASTAAAAALITTLNAQAPADVFGKEYTTTPDTDATGAAAGGQILLWDGLGNVVNGPVVPIPIGSGLNVIEIDAQAHLTDALFREVLANTADLTISVVGDRAADQARIWYERPAGSVGVWATAGQVNSLFAGATFPRGDVNSLELWGPAESDTTHVSLLNDPASGAAAAPIKYSIYTAAGVGVVTTAEIATAIGLSVDFLGLVDLDGLFIEDTNGNGLLDGGVPGQLPGDTIIFSIMAAAGLPFDGGEIWTYVLGGGAGPATFLNHGGHLWDTAFDVKGTFGVASEDVDAIEAVIIPEPGTIAAGLGVGSLALLGWYRSRRNR
jgi:hypothetical protein